MQDFKLQDLLTRLSFDDAPAGGACIIHHQGRTLQASAGLMAPDTPWHVDALSLNYSIGKGMLATLVHVLASQDAFDYDAPIASIWSEFGQNGKAHITLADVLAHRADLFDITTVTTNSQDMLDWSLMLDKIAKMPQKAPDGVECVSAYSALVFGWVVGGFLERATGKPLQSLLDEHLAAPLDMQGQMYFTLPYDKIDAVARPVRAFTRGQHVRTKPTLKPDTKEMLELWQSLPIYPIWRDKVKGAINSRNVNKLYFDTTRLNLSNYKRALMPDGRHAFDYYHDDALTATIPGSNAIASARALGAMYAMLAQGGIYQGKRLIDAKIFERATAVQETDAHKQAMDAVMPATMRWRLGYHNAFSVFDVSNAFGHMGYNGCAAWCDPSRDLAFVFLHNFDATMLGDIRQFALSESILVDA